MANERLAVEWNMPCRIEIIPDFDIEIIAIIRGLLTINKEYSVDDIIGHAKIVPEGTVEYTFPCTIRTDKLKYSTNILGHTKLEMYKSIYDNIIQGSLKYERSKIINDPTTEIYGRVNIDKTSFSDDDSEIPIVDPLKDIRSNEIYGSINISKNKIKENIISGSAKILPDPVSIELPGSVRLEIYRDVYDNIIVGSFRYVANHIRSDLQGSLKYIPETTSTEISGSITLQQCLKDPEGYSNEIHGRITIDRNDINNEIIGSLKYERSNTIDDSTTDIVLLGSLKYERSKMINDPTTEIYGRINLTKDKIDNEIIGLVTHELMSLEEYKRDDDPYIIHYPQHNEIQGYAKIENDQMFHTVLDGHGLTKRYDITITEPDKDDPIHEEIDWYAYQLNGSLNYQRDQRIIDIYSKAILEKTGNIDTDLQGHLVIELQQIKEPSILGHAKIYLHYRSLDIPCRIKTRKCKFIHSIFAQIKVPRERNIIIPCRITVDDTNVFTSTILKGYLTILPRDKMETDLQGHVKYEPGTCIDIKGHGFIDAIYTRREFDCRIDIIIPEEIYILCTIDVAEHIPKPHREPPPIPPTNYYAIPKGLEPIIDRDPKRVHITIDENSSKAIQHLRTIEKKYKEEHKSHLPKGKIIIAVSPTWNYEPYVFKNSLITFLDRYYRKADIAVVFGGNPRSDFDIINLCLNYKIDKDNLCCIMGDKASDRGQFFVQKFINTMVEFKKDEYPNILRVFMFVNQPNWYYNDPLSALATYCKTNNISAVAISPGGEYNEICEVDKIIDDLNSGIEWERQHRNHRTEYINIRLEDNQDRLVY